MLAHTFGNSDAAVVLAKILSKPENGNARKNITRMLTDFNRTLNQLKTLDSRVGLGLGRLSYEHYQIWFGKYEGEVQTFALNVLSTNYKRWRELMKGNKAYKHRK
jgi:hypothetical protein